MSKVLVFAGTTEGRKVAEYLKNHGQPAHVCVATEYGEKLLPDSDLLTVSHDRLDQRKMIDLIKEIQADPVIDATHPYASEVTENIQSACQKTDTKYIRLLREASQYEKDQPDSRVIYAKSVKDAVSYLEHTTGNILAATGSKEIEEFTKLTNYQERVFARVLSLPQVAAHCAKLGFEGKHLICMQGPFTKEMNVAMLKQLNCDYLVTKESGTAGGFQEKWEAAEECGSKLVIIGRSSKEEGISLTECKTYLQNKFGWNPMPQISLVGIGMGSAGTFTAAGQQACERADLIIGAGRMTKAAAKSGQAVYDEYRPEKILSYIKEHPEYEQIVIALSGDVGFYSGAKKLSHSLREYPLQMICGISTVSYFMARLGKPWEDVCITSIHGKESNLITQIKENDKVFSLLGTAHGVADLANALIKYRLEEVILFVGEQLSYPDEKVLQGKPCEFVNYQGNPLSAVYIENPKPQNIITHGIADKEFLRDRIPMTKEEIRSISLSKLRLTKDAVCYDIGAGTGSVSIEMAVQAAEGHVYAIEKNPLAIELIKKNKMEFAADHLTVIEGLAPTAMEELPAPTHAFIGGSSGNMREIMEAVLDKNPQIRIVINCITLETIAEIMGCIKELPVTDVDIATVGVSKSKTAGSYHMMHGENPITIVSCSGGGR